MTQMNPENNFTTSVNGRRAGIGEALETIKRSAGPLPSAAIFEHGTLQIKMYRPVETDRQQPHDRDEVYFVASGSGWFVNGSDRHPFASGDMLFVPAGIVHRFEDFTDDFCTWVVFYGPEGGERP
jgi:mannose-6-phosphate isomerase-like protein (cupin superfamily)